MTPTFILQQSLHGLVYGMLLFLVTAGLTLAFGMMRILNIAHAGFYMLGAYLAVVLTPRVNAFAVPLLAGLIVAIFGAMFESSLLRRAARLGSVHELLLTFGAFFVIQEAILWIWGGYPLRVAMPPVLKATVPLFDMQYPVYRLYVVCASVLVCLLMALVMLRTRLGIIVRSAVSDAPMVSALGINTEWVRVGVFASAAGLAGLAGAIAAPLLQADPSMGRLMLLDGFIVVVVGGLGSLLGALVAAITLGQLQAFGVVLFPEAAMVLPYLLMASVLVVRPQGLFGRSA